MAGPFGYEQPWVPARSPFALADELDGAGDVAFDVSAFPTEESIIAELEAEQAVPQPGSIFEPVADAAARDESQALALANELQAPSWADAQMSPEAEAELTGEPLPPESFSADPARHQGGLGGELDPGIVNPSRLPMWQTAPVTDAGLGADIELDPAGVISPYSTPLSDEEIEGVPGAEAIPVQDLSDEALAMRQLEQDSAAEEFRKKREREEFDAKTERDARRAEVYTAEIAKAKVRTEEILARSQEIGRQFVDNDRWVNSRSTGSKIGMALSILSSGQLGILSGRGGNESLDFFQSLINQDIETQKFNIEKGVQDLNRDKGLVATLYEQTGDLNEAAQAASLAVYEAGIAKIEGEIARTDPESSQIVRLEIKRRQLRANADAQRAAIMAKGQADARAKAKHDIELADKQSAIDKRAVESAAAAKKAGLRQDDDGNWVNAPGSGGKKAKKPGIRELVFAKDNGYRWNEQLGDYEIDPNFKGEPADPTAVAELGLKETELGIRKNELEMKEEARSVPGLTMEGGKPYEALTDVEAAKIREQKAALDSAVAILDDMNILRHDAGVELFGSQEGKLMDSKMAALGLMVRKVEGTGALDEGSWKVIKQKLLGGSKEPSKTLRDFDRVLDAARLDMVNSFHNTAKGAARPGLKYERYEPPMKSKEQARRKTKEQRRAGATQGIPEAFKNDPEQRSKSVENMRADAEWFGNRDNPTIDEMRSMGRDLQGLIIGQEITADEAISVATPWAKTLAKKEHLRFQETPIEKLEEEYGSRQAVVRYADTLKKVLNGDESAVFDFVIRPGYE